jgi:hypothetical protein
MLQRLQTIYLLIVSLLTALLFFFPFCRLVFTGEEHLSEWLSPLFFSPLVILSFLLSLGSIFLYKSRSLQIKSSYINIIIFIAMYAMAYWNYSTLPERFDFWNLQFAVVIPLINIILTLLAIRHIKKDEKLVRSLDRLR